MELLKYIIPGLLSLGSLPLQQREAFIAKGLDLVLHLHLLLFLRLPLIQRLPCRRAVEIKPIVIARLLTAIRYPEHPVEPRKEEQVADDDLEAEENHVESGLAIIPRRMRSRSRSRPGRPGTEACDERDEEESHAQDSQL